MTIRCKLGFPNCKLLKLSTMQAWFCTNKWKLKLGYEIIAWFCTNKWKLKLGYEINKSNQQAENFQV